MNLLLTHAMSMENDMDNIKKKANLFDAEITRRERVLEEATFHPIGMLRKMYQAMTDKKRLYFLLGI